MRKLTVIISLIMCALLVFGCASAPEQPAAPEEQEASRPDDSEPPIDSGFTWDDGTAEDMEGHIIYPDIQLNFKEDGRVLEFTGEDLEGNKVDSKELFAKAKVTMINVWGTFCSPCIMEMPDLGELSREYADKDFQVTWHNKRRPQRRQRREQGRGRYNRAHQGGLHPPAPQRQHD